MLGPMRPSRHRQVLLARLLALHLLLALIWLPQLHDCRLADGCAGHGPRSDVPGCHPATSGPDGGADACLACLFLANVGHGVVPDGPPPARLRLLSEVASAVLEFQPDRVTLSLVLPRGPPSA